MRVAIVRSSGVGLRLARVRRSLGVLAVLRRHAVLDPHLGLGILGARRATAGGDHALHATALTRQVVGAGVLVEVRGVHPFHVLIIQIMFQAQARRGGLLGEDFHVAEACVGAAAHSLVEDRLLRVRLRIVAHQHIARRAHGQVLIHFAVCFCLAPRRMERLLILIIILIAVPTDALELARRAQRALPLHSRALRLRLECRLCLINLLRVLLLLALFLPLLHDFLFRLSACALFLI